MGAASIRLSRKGFTPLPAAGNGFGPRLTFLKGNFYELLTTLKSRQRTCIPRLKIRVGALFFLGRMGPATSGDQCLFGEMR